MKTLKLFLVALLLAACATVPASTPERPRQTEEWFIVITPEVLDKALAPRPELKMSKTYALAPGKFGVRTYRFRAVPELDRAEVLSHAAGQLVLLWHDMPIRLHIVEQAPPDAKRVVKVQTKMEGPEKFKYLMGIADGIDPLNQDDTHSVLCFLSTLIEVMRLDPHREVANPVAGSIPPTSKEVGLALGVLIAHEIAHTIGCRHQVLEAEHDLNTVMAQGADKYTIKYLDSVHWHYQTRVYLWCMLNNIKLPAWLKYKYKYDGKAAAQHRCKSCGH